MSFLGIDIGTTGCKAAAYNNEGDQLSFAYKEYPILSPNPGWAELEPDTLWKSVQSCISLVASQLKNDPIQGISISSLGEAILPISLEGVPISNCIVSFDNRASHQFNCFMNRVEPDIVHNETGLFPEPHYSIFKIMWWKDEHPEVYQAAWKFLCVGDYIGFKLGLEPVMDYSMATRTLAFNIHDFTWSRTMLDAAGIESSKLPKTASSGTIIGDVPENTSSSLSIPPNTRLVLGGLDQACTALGSGVISHGDTLLSLGTVGAIGPVFSSPTEQMREQRILSMPHVVPKVNITFGATIGGGSVLRWYRDQFGKEEREIAKRSNRDVYEVIIDQVQDHPIDLLFLPHLAGSRFAFNDPQSQAIISGLSFESTKSDIIRALLEGVAYELAIIRERIEKAGISIHLLHAAGGGSRSDKWMQIIADSMQTPIYTMQISDAGTLGCALLCAKAAGEFVSFVDGVKKFTKIRKKLEPRKSWAIYHSERIAKYKDLYHRMKGLNITHH